MRRFKPCLAVLACIACALSSTVWAGPPSPATSTLPCSIRLAGEFAAAPIVEPNGEFKVIVRDAASVPQAGLLVVVDFSACVPDIQMDAPPGQPFPGITVNCPVHTVTAITDPSGTATFRIVGKAINPICGISPGAPYHCAQISAGTAALMVPLGNVTVNTLDYNGDNQVTTPDLSCLIADFFGNNLQARGDFNCDGALTVLDISTWVGLFFASSANTIIPGPFCIPAP
jgi:hypothetical protein